MTYEKDKSLPKLIIKWGIITAFVLMALFSFGWNIWGYYQDRQVTKERTICQTCYQQGVAEVGQTIRNQTAMGQEFILDFGKNEDGSDNQITIIQKGD